MFDKKQNYLFGAEPVKSVEFTTSGNGAPKLTSTGDPFVDQFAFITNYRNPRPFADIADDMETLWKSNPLNAMKLTFYIRLITRKVELFDGTTTSKVQKGQGLKYEAIMRMIWVAINYPEVFYDNLPLFVAAGCWKDIIQMMSYDLQFHGWKKRVLDWKKLSDFILAGLENTNTSDLVKKYLPNIKARSKCHTLESQADTIIGKYLSHRLFNGNVTFNPNEYYSLNYKNYRTLKTSGTAHQWQQQISRGNFNINFKSVHGRALALLVSSKFLENHNLVEKYEKWIESQPVAKFTGYVYELFKNFNCTSKNYRAITINKQFEGLIKTAKEDANTKSTFLVARDTSSSMRSEVPGTGVSSDSIAKAMALYFSSLLDGPFSNCYVEFDNTARLVSWVGKTATEKFLNDTHDAYGSTNFLGIVPIFTSLFKQGVSIDKFPTGLICLSDGEFNRPSGWSSNPSLNKSKTNFSEFKSRLLSAGFPKKYVDNFKIILWDIPNGYYSNETRPKFESFASTPNFFYMSGLDPAGISFLLGEEAKPETAPKTPRELFEAAMNQELLNLIVI